MLWFIVDVCSLFCYSLLVDVQCERKFLRIINRCLAKNLQETACGGSVISTDCGSS